MSQQVKERVIDFANKISRTKRGAKTEIKPHDPEYKILAAVMTDEMADVCMGMLLDKPSTVAEIAKRLNRTDLDHVHKLLEESAQAGCAFVNVINGEDQYWHTIWVPGHMEIIANTKDVLNKDPELARLFDVYGKKKGPMASGMLPMGVGPMRVIPIERAIDGESRNASYEEVSKFLEESKFFSVSDCACRTAREASGEGCGHLKEDMCIQLGHAAEYYIRTGRGRAISKEQAYEIIKKAEDNGLMHNIPNLDGFGKTHAICNCCGCGCFAMRNTVGYANPEFNRSNWQAQVDKDKCVACGECVENCPANALKLGQKLCTHTPIKIKKHDTPDDVKWGPEQFNLDYRTNKQVVVETGTSPCKAECPAHIGIQGYIKLASQGKYKEALELIKTENPLPAVCGRICPHPCESACTRGDIDNPVAIDDIKKFIAQKDLEEEHRFIPRIKHEYGKKIAVIGSGPAGISCAYYLATDGYKVTVFEKEEKLGGMLTLGIPSFRLEKDVINSEIKVLKEIGVEFKTGVEVGKDISLDEMRKQGYKAFYMAVGAQGGRMLGIEGEDAADVMTGIDFLRDVNLGKDIKLKGKTIVIGGGNVAMDVARTAVRCGSEQVDLFCLEARDIMPALIEEIEEAESEDVIISNSWGPKRVVVENGRVVGVEFKKCLSVFDAEGRFNPQYDETDTKIVEANTVLLSIGQTIEWGTLLDGTNIELNRNNSVKADPITFQTGEPDIFVGGDALTGPKFAIDAIAAGKEGAISIHRFVNKGQSLTIGRLNRDYRPLDKENLNLAGYDTVPRERTRHVDGQKSKNTFDDLRGILTEEQIQKETERCLGCGAVQVDEFMCVGCGACTLKCKFDAIKLVRRYNVESVEIEELKPIVIKHVLKRKAKVALKAPVRAIRKAFRID
jgi:NADPH-dependent glutamate synthase beta subunit-like oxidoreductase/NAD-dependent dihydropyrimidine dehydrogenase PreA subunit